jgi:glyoxylase-like metal-dependent hydrolase (beta-lactamase superfamily II)
MTESSFRFRLGNFECISVLDTIEPMDFGFFFPKIPASDISKLLKDLNVPMPNEFHISCLVVKTGKQTVLIDTGNGASAKPGVGLLLENLKKAGVKPESIDTVILSHGHLDHIGGNVNSALKPNYPNARYIIHKKEWEFWLSEPELKQMQEFMRKEILDSVHKNLLTLKDTILPVEAGKNILPGFQYFETPGHTPGHASVVINSEEEQLIYAGDTLHNILQLARPDWTTPIDLSPETAIASRKKIIREVVTTHPTVFVGHFPFPCIGNIQQKEAIYLWKPLA